VATTIHSHKRKLTMPPYLPRLQHTNTDQDQDQPQHARNPPVSKCRPRHLQLTCLLCFCSPVVGLYIHAVTFLLFPFSFHIILFMTVVANIQTTLDSTSTACVASNPRVSNPTLGSTSSSYALVVVTLDIRCVGRLPCQRSHL